MACSLTGLTFQREGFLKKCLTINSQSKICFFDAFYIIYMETVIIDGFISNENKLYLMQERKTDVLSLVVVFGRRFRGGDISLT